MRSYDIDGVITAGVVPQMPCIIVSGRVGSLLVGSVVQTTNYDRTLQQLAELKIDPKIPVYLRPGGVPDSRVAAGVWKATVINAAGVDEHFDDDQMQGHIIQELTRAKVVIVQRKT